MNNLTTRCTSRSSVSFVVRCRPYAAGAADEAEPARRRERHRRRGRVCLQLLRPQQPVSDDDPARATPAPNTARSAAYRTDRGDIYSRRREPCSTPALRPTAWGAAADGVDSGALTQRQPQTAFNCPRQLLRCYSFLYYEAPLNSNHHRRE